MKTSNPSVVTAHTATSTKITHVKKSAKPTKHVVDPKKSAAATRAADKAWEFMRSKTYVAIKSNAKLTDAQKRERIDALKAKRAA